MSDSVLFHEESDRVKNLYRLIASLFFIGFFIGLIAIIIYRIIKPIGIITYYQPQGEDILATIICLFAAIYFSILIVRYRNYIKNIEITNNVISFIIEKYQIKYNKADLIDYQIEQKRFIYEEYILKFNDSMSFHFISRKTEKLSNVLDNMLKNNKDI